MKISELENIILENSSKISILRGKNLIEDKSLNISIHKVDNFYNVYGDLKDNRTLKNYKPHLRIDVKNKKLTFTKCNCSIFEESNLKNRIYMCEHLVAAGLKFIDNVKKRLVSKKNEDEREDKKIIKELENAYLMYSSEKKPILYKKKELKINISLKEVKDRPDKFFDISLYLGDTHMYPVLNIKECILAIKNDGEYCVGKGFVYTKDKYYFNENDMEFIDYIYEFIFINSNENKSFLRVHSNILRKFLEKLQDKQIKFNYNYVNYVSSILKKDLPLSFTMKKINDDYILTTKKIFPVPLNDNMDIFLYDRNLYIPSFKQIELYKILYKYLRENKKIVFKCDINNEEFAILNKVIMSISQNVFYDEGILEKLNEGFKVDFSFSRRNGSSICNVIIKNNLTEMNYCDAVKINNENFNLSKKINLIERILNKYRFYYRNEVFEFLGEDEEYYNFLKNGIKEIQSIGNIFTQPSSLEYFKLNTGKFKEFSVKEKLNGMYDFHMQLENISPYELNEVVKAYKEKKSFIKLDSNIYVDLESSEIAKIIKIIDSLNLNIMSEKDRFELTFDKLYYLKEKIKSEDILGDNRKRMLKFFESIDSKHDKNYAVPKKLNCSLREYQKQGYNWFKNLSELGMGGILGDEMGLGKTVQTIAFLASEEKQTSLIVVPTSLLYNWNDEFEKFAPKLNICVIHGEKKEREKLLENYYEYDVILTTYGTLKNDCNVYENIEFKNIILDEGQNIKNYKAQITVMVKKLKAKSRFILTGTPIENNLNELWSLFDFIMPGYLYSNKEFNEKFIKDDSNMEELKLLIRPYILRRTKKEVLGEMPEKYEKRILVEMPKEQKDIYDSFVKEIHKKVNDEELNNMAIFSCITRLRQLCLDPSLVISDYNGQSGKYNEILKIIKCDKRKNKILLFSQFTSALKKLSVILNSEHIKYSYLDGSITSVNRMKLVEEFNNDEEKRVFLISLKAGGTGLNLTSANTVIHLDPWWNPSIEDQASDRAHRIGQKNNVEVIKLIAQGTIEEKILLLQEDKRTMINDVLTNELNDNSVLNLITSKELINLLK